MKKLNIKRILIFCLSIFLLLCGQLSCFALCGYKYTLDDALNLLEFTNTDQKEAFRSVCKQAGVQTSEKFDVMEAMKLVDSTQKQLVNRKDKQERWETSPLNWMNKESDTIMGNLKTLGFVDAVLPQRQEYDAVCIFGARMPAMKDRIKYLESMVSQGLNTKKIILLTGERYAADKIDGTKEELSEIAKAFNIGTNELTEAHLFKYLYDRSSLCGNFELIIINTPQREGFRPTTKTTLDDFCEWHKNHLEVKNTLFISSQPHVKYQKAIVSEVLRSKKSNLEVEIVGDECKSKNIQDIVGALGAYIWIYMPHCLRSMGFTIESENIDIAKKLYGHQQWIYNYLPIKDSIMQ